ncbi:MAG: DUF2335 domain-containing protein [Thermoanaerobaculia bacterium]
MTDRPPTNGENSRRKSRSTIENGKSAGSPVADKAVVRAFSASFSGPLPPPQTLAQYNQAFPGAAERIVRMAESQSAHRRSLESARVHADIDNEKRGQVLAFIIALVVFLGSLAIVWQGKSVAGITVMLAELATLAGLFIYGKESKTRQLERRRQELLETATEDEE